MVSRSTFSALMRLCTEMEGYCSPAATSMASEVVNVDFRDRSQLPENAHMHAMGTAGYRWVWRENAYESFLSDATRVGDYAAAIHAIQDSTAGGHVGFQDWDGGGAFGFPGFHHVYDDTFPKIENLREALRRTREYIHKNMPGPRACGCTQ